MKPSREEIKQMPSLRTLYVFDYGDKLIAVDVVKETENQLKIRGPYAGLDTRSKSVIGERYFETREAAWKARIHLIVREIESRKQQLHDLRTQLGMAESELKREIAAP